MKTNIYIKSALGTLLLAILYWFTSLLFASPNVQGNIALSFLANYLIALVLGYYIMYSSHQGVKLMFIVFTIYFLIGHFTILVEALIFNVTNRGETVNEIVRGFLVAGIFSPIYTYLFGKKNTPDTLRFMPRSYTSWIWRVLLGNVLYLLFYLTAGFMLTLAYPQILQFYEGKIPPFDVMIETQLFIRGFIFVGVAILILRTLPISVHKKAIFIGFVFAILGGIAPLIPPNALMPGYVRLGHGVEVGVSNFLYGIVLGYLLKQRQLDPE